MRALFVCTSSAVFGAERITLLLLDGLRRRGHAIFAVTSPRQWGNGDFQRRLDDLGVQHSELHLGVLSKTLAWVPIRDTCVTLTHLPVTWRRFTEIRKRFVPDVVIATSHRHVAALWPVLDPASTLLYLHNTPRRSGRAAAAINRVIDRRLHGYVAVSEFVRQAAIGAGIRGERVFTVRNGVEIPDPDLAMRRFDRRVPHIGIVGQIGPWKGHDCLLGAAKRLAHSGLDFKLLVFGGGGQQYVDSLKDQATRMGIADRLEWMGYIPSQTAIFNNLDICVVPSRINEGFGLVAAESAAHGVPVIATRRGALPEVVVEGVTGLTVDEPLEESLAEKLTVLLRSPELRIRFGTDAAIHARQVLSAQRMIDDFEALCRQLGYCAKGIAR